MNLGGGLGGGGGLFGANQGGLGGLTGGLGGTNTSGGLFGNQLGGGRGLFGANAASTGGGLFSSQTPASQSGGLFTGTTGGGLGAGGGLFQSPQGGGLARGGLFGQSPSLGGTVASTGLGGGMLGGGGGLFSNTQTTPSSGLFKSQIAAPGLGATGGGLGATGGGLFGMQSKGIGLGGMLGGGLAGGAGVNKFEPVPGNDTVNKNGITHTVSTKLHCISAMKQYEQSKISLEEIRLNDYMAGRKGGGGLGAGVGMGGGGLLGGLGGGAGAGGGLFQNKALGGGLGGGLFGQTSQQQLGGLGTATSTTGGLFGQPKLGGGGLLNTSTQNTLGGGLGAGGGLFNQPGSQAGGLFGTQTPSVGGGLFSQPSTSQITGLGGTQLVRGGLLNSSLTGGLGQTSLQSSQAGSLGLFNKPLGSSALGGGLSLAPGQGTQLGGGGLSLGGLGTSGLGGGLNTGLGLGGQSRLGGGLFSGGVGGIGTGIGTSGAVQNTNLGNSALQSVSLQQQQAHLNQQLENLANSPFGDSPLFRSALSDSAKRKTKERSTPVLSKATPTHTPHYKLNMRPSAKLKPMSLSSPSRHHERSKLFEGFDDSRLTSVGGVGGGETFVPRSNIKKLTIKPKPSQPVPVPDSTTPPFTEPTRPRPLDTTPTGPRTAAFPSTPTPPHRTQDTSVESPQITVGATPLKKPVAIRPQATPTTMLATPPVVSMSVGSSAVSPPSSRTSPIKSLIGAGSLTRSPLQRTTEPKSSRPCEVTLPSGYYTIPPMDELDSIANSSQCNVKGFTVGRRGFGEVHFPGVTDVFGLDLVKLVFIGSKEVVVYPDDTDKPSEGEGLNKRAVVKLEGNWPVDKSTREVIRDAERIERMGYCHKLKRMTEKIGATFQDYDPVSGTCVFEVDHFSKYKLVADDDSDDEGGEQEVGGVKKLKTQGADKHQPQPTTIPAQQVKNTRQTSQQLVTETRQTGQQLGTETRQTGQQLGTETRQPAFPKQRTDEDESMSDEEDFEDAVGVVTTLEPRPPPLPVSQQLAVSMGVRAHRVQVMKASFFGGEERTQPSYQRHEERAEPSYQRPSLHHRLQSGRSTPATPSYQSPGLLRMDRIPSSQQATPLGPSPLSYRRTIELPQSHTPPSSTLQAQSAILMSKRDLRTLIPHQDSLMNHKERCIADHGLFMGQSFRVGWGPNWTLAHSGSQISNPSTGKVSLFTGFGRPHVDKESGLPIRAVLERIGARKGDSVAAYYDQFLQVQLDNTEFSMQATPTHAPQCTPVVGNTLLHAFAELVSDQTTPSTGSLATEQLKRVLNLSVALWGDLAGDPDPESYDHSMTRRRALYQWLKTTNDSVTKQDAGNTESEHYLKALFSLVAGQQLGEACKLAHENHDHKLALLLSQATQNTILNRAYIHKQLEDWRAQTVDRHIDLNRLKLYVLLAGTMVWELSPPQRRGDDERGLVNVCEGLDWKRVMALHLCYGSVPSASIDTALSSYLEAFQGDSPYATPPLPPYLEEDQARNEGEPLPSDTCLHLLQLYCHRDHSLEETLSPAASTSHHLDYGISWLLWSVLTALGYTHMQPTRQTQLHTSFSGQLECEGGWQWAVFVLQHIADSVLLEGAVRELLARNCSSCEELDVRETFVVEQLHVPREWVYDAKALRAKYEDNHELEAWHLLEAGKWNDAHIVILKYLTAEAIINDDSEDLLQMLEHLSDRDRFASVQDWDIGGSVFLDFLHIGDRLVNLSHAQNVPADCEQLVEEIHLGLNALASRIGQVECHTPKEVLCQAEMAKRTATYTKLVLSLKYPDGSVDTPLADEYSCTIGQLPLPSDYALVEYRTLIQPCLNELAKCY